MNPLVAFFLGMSAFAAIEVLGCALALWLVPGADRWILPGGEAER